MAWCAPVRLVGLLLGVGELCRLPVMMVGVRFIKLLLLRGSDARVSLSLFSVPFSERFALVHTRRGGSVLSARLSFSMQLTMDPLFL